MTTIEIQDLLESHFLRLPHLITKMQKVLKHPSAYLCLQFIWYKTGGWAKGSDTLSYSQFKKDNVHGLWVSTKTIQRGVLFLEKMGVINAKPSFNSMYEYSLNIESIKQLVLAEELKTAQLGGNEWVVIMSTPLDNLTVSKDDLSFECGHNDQHKRTLTKEPITKEEATNVSKQDKPAAAKKTTTATKPAAKKKETTKPFNPVTDYPVPDFIDMELWTAYHAMRNAKKKPATEYACKLVIDKLAEWNKAGLDIHSAIKDSISNSWTDVFEPKAQSQAQKQAQRKTADPLAVNSAWGQSNEMTDEERAAYLGIDTSNQDNQPPLFDEPYAGVTQL